MEDRQCVRFLRWALPRLHMHWPGFRKVRRQVCRRLDRRWRELGLADADEYRRYLRTHADEWQRLDAMCRITISRFYRDRIVFATLALKVLPALANEALQRGDRTLKIWSAGCGSGEEPYTLSILWRCELQTRHPEFTIDILATDADPVLIHRALEAHYEFSSLKELPERYRDAAFAHDGAVYRLEPEFRQRVHFLEQDIRQIRPEGPFDLVLCRNLVLTYYDHDTRIAVLKKIVAAMRRGAALVIGAHENLPDHEEELSPWFDKRHIFRRK